ncbi:M23 family metallopeptidase [Noviherbaspirillum galbum]|uniref:M23 family metallopeptidase n=1 Tax=Noviherbaspirillum galbum TaxID=2709383 RepID=A0A6B3SYL7_9BURK|nr:M23 family metallopeptidase [Noviherbaspirillum galbum]NEX64546.1 M23 family metallopeptidase [Noviherbaspirillum galbum]
MQIIVLHPRFKARSLTLTHWHLAAAAVCFIVAVLAVAALLYYLTFRHAADKLPIVRDMVASASASEAASQEDVTRKDRYVKENLAAMATKLGEMQAQLMRLDALGERVQGLAGVKPQEFNFRELPGRGGALPSGTAQQSPVSMSEFQELIDAMARDVEHRADYMSMVESNLMGLKVRSRMLPTIAPVNVGYNASGFGWRFDPFTGRNTFHEGIDFAAGAGTHIVAAAGGVVIAAEYHHQYGNMLEIDHGNDIVTRYAHASRLHAKVGDIVRRGQHVADIGSTGRSTGAHLHFEVLVKRVPQNPHKFLTAGADPALASRLAAN